MHGIAFALLVGLVMAVTPAWADSVAVTSGPNGTSIVNNGQPCRVVTDHDAGSTENSTSIHSGPGGVSGTTSVSPGGGQSVTVGSGSSSNRSDCVIHQGR